MINKFIFLVFTITTLLSCSNELPHNPTQYILLFKDKDGLYQYNPISKKEKLIFKATENQVFLDEPYKLSGDTLTFGFKGELEFKDSTNNSMSESYYKDYFSVDLKSGNNWKSKKILYEVLGNHTLKVKTLLFTSSGEKYFVTDTTMKYKGSYTTSKGIIYNDFKPRFYSYSTLGDKTVYSYRGNIYLINKLDTTLLVKYNGDFDPKFGSGYFEPQLDPKGKYVVFRYLPGFMNLKENSSLQKIELNTNNVSVFIDGEFDEPTFSVDGNFLLFKRNEKEGYKNTWISDIYLLDLSSMKEQKISNAYSAKWQ